MTDHLKGRSLKRECPNFTY